MNQRKNGFTLIELLAVIVILGVIAVIAVPIVKNITNDAKMKSFMNSARGIIRAGDLYYSRKDMMDEISGDMTFEFPNNASELEINGKLPESGSMIINEDGDIALAISNGKYCVTKGFSDKDITITENFEMCKIPRDIIIGEEVYFNPVKNAICDKTTEYTSANSEMGVKTGCMRWYVYKMDDNNVGLILDHNTSVNVAWISEEDYGCGVAGDYCSLNDKGPLTLNNQLKLDTENQGWKVKAEIIDALDVVKLIPYFSKLEDINTWQDYWIEYLGLFNAANKDCKASVQQSDYSTVDEYLDARIDYVENKYPNVALPRFLYLDMMAEDLTKSLIGEEASAYGYWTSTVIAGSSDTVWYVDYAGFINGDSVYYTDFNGLRPVISLSKSVIQ